MFGEFLIDLKHAPVDVEITYTILNTALQTILSKKNTQSHHAVLSNELRAEILKLSQPKQARNCCSIM